MKLKVCGMKYGQNIKDIAALNPDYMGFIFYEGSARNMEYEIPEIDETIKKAGVFVNETISKIINRIEKYKLDAVQLHGQETSEFCESLRQEIQKTGSSKQTIIIKAFSVDKNFDFDHLSSFEEQCDYFLFDTKGELPGGNGIAFDWNLLSEYKSQKPYFLSGGIGLDALKDLKEFKRNPVAELCHAIDINSKFEDSPGLKNKEKIKEFKTKL